MKPAIRTPRGELAGADVAAIAVALEVLGVTQVMPEPHERANSRVAEVAPRWRAAGRSYGAYDDAVTQRRA